MLLSQRGLFLLRNQVFCLLANWIVFVAVNSIALSIVERLFKTSLARDVLNNRSTIDKAIELTATKTIQFAKRQKTWFRNKNNPLWLNNKNLLKDAIIKIESFLS